MSQWHEKGFDLSYGASGAGKTKWAMDIADYIHAMTGKKSRWYIGDGGLATIEASGLIDDGIVEVFNYNERDWPLSIIQQITEGYWPEHLDDPESPLIAPGKKEFAEVGMWTFEGIYVMGEYIMGSMRGGLADRASRGEKLGQDAPFTITEGSGSEKMSFGGNSMAHFGFGQRRIIDAIQRSKALPGFVQWTSHEQAAEDKDNGGEKIIGPAAVGNKLTPKLALWFSNTIHHTTATKKSKVTDPTTQKQSDVYTVERRAYTRDHGDPDGTVFTKSIANSRVATYVDDKGNVINPMPEFLYPADPLRFYEIVTEAKDRARAERKKTRGGTK